jgi:hypothetical protein
LCNGRPDASGEPHSPVSRDFHWNAAVVLAYCFGTLSKEVKKAVILSVAVASWLAASADAATGRQTPGGLVPAVVAGLQPVGRLGASQRLRLAIGLAPRDQAGLDAFLQDLYDPASPNYRHYLNPEQFTARFGPTERDYKVLIDYAQTNGLSVRRQYPHRLVLDVEGAVADIEKALHITLRTYPHPTEARAFFAPDAEPSLALPVRILHIGGLNNYTRPHPKHRHREAGPGASAIPRQGGSAPGGQLWGSDFRNAYVPGTTLTGAGQNLGLLEFEDFYPIDITNYENAIGLSAGQRPQLVVVPLNGTATPADGGDNGEECTVDIEMAIAMAPGLSSIYVFENASPDESNPEFDDIFASMVLYTNVLQFSCSWGGSTDADPESDVLLKEMAAQGQSFFDASGDIGAFVGAVQYPSDIISMTQVGGTTLTMSGTPSYSWVSEVVWAPYSGPNVPPATSSATDAAESSSGGISTYYAIPGWQTNISMASNLGSTTMRNTPDVAAAADNCYLFTDDGQQGGGWGGTSCAAPLWAGFAALMNEQAAAIGVPPVGFLNPALYALASGANYTDYFHDITSGNNTWDQSPGQFFAVPGYDLCCGLGTINGTNLLNALVAPPVELPRAAGYTLASTEPCHDGVANPGETVAVNLILQNAGGVPCTNLVATLLPYLVYRGQTAPGTAAPVDVIESLLANNQTAFPSGPQTIGALAPRAFATNAFSFFADGSCGQTITAVLQLQDGPADLGTVSYTFQLGVLSTTTSYSWNFDGVPAGNWPAGWSAGGASAGLTAWTTENSANDGTVNVAYCPDAPNPGEVILYSPTISLPAGSNLLSFLNDYNLETTYDGGVLEIAIGGSSFADILAAGGSFITNGYNATITDIGDSAGRQSPLIGRQTWTGNSLGAQTTIVALPAAASGASIQLCWVCGTDYGNENLVGVGGWWIDDIAIYQQHFDCSSCPATNVSTPTIVFPTNGYSFASISPTVVVTGLAPESSNVIIDASGTSNLTVTADANGVYAAVATLGYGSNTLTAQGQTNAVNIFIVLAPPILDVPSVANTNVRISGTGAAGATVSLYEGDSTNGPFLESFLITNASGAFSTVVTLPLGNDALTATEALEGQTSAATAPAAISVVPLPPPVIVSPVTGWVTNRASLTLRGTGTPNASVSIQDITFTGTNLLATKTINKKGKFSFAVDLADGANTLLATQALNGVVSPPSAPVQITDYLAPQILVQPVNQTNFLKGTVTFSAEVVGAAPLRIFWGRTTNGTTEMVRIPGATNSSYKLSNLKASQTNNAYGLVASNKHGVARSRAATLTLVTNPFTAELTGAYCGLFANSPAQFESSGLLTLNLTSLGRFSARILNAGGSYSFSGGLSGVGWWSNAVSRGPGHTPLSVVLNLNVTNGAQPILGAVSAGTNWIASLEADRATYSTARHFPGRGSYTLIFGGAGNSQGPGGDGYGTVSVGTNGLVSLRGVLSDNTAVAPAAVSVSSDGRWPLYIPLYGRFGSLAGWIDFTNQGPSLADLTGTNGGPCSFAASNVMWFRTNAGGKLYPDGFTNSLIVVGSAFSPGTNATLLDLPVLQFMVSGGGLAGPLTNSVAGLPGGKFTNGSGGIPKLTLDLNPATGVIKGGFADPAAAKGNATIKGVVFQQQTNAAGFFLGSTNSGSFLLTPP